MSRPGERKELDEIETVMDEKLNTLTEDVNAQLKGFRDQIAELQKKTTERISERPLLALGVAFVLGMALGLAISRSRG